MIKIIAIRLSNAWGENSIVSKEDVECYRYGLELLISTIINFILTVVVSLIFGRLYSFLPFTIVYVPMRLYAGGYHAKNHFRCILFSTALFCIAVIVQGAITITNIVGSKQSNSANTRWRSHTKVSGYDDAGSLTVNSGYINDRSKSAWHEYYIGNNLQKRWQEN
ncbi:MAG: hypothetical protein E7265_10815 [Lachnospiraceae bacterium]|nr:hypothetical protein [Lachnospiraceae bacterium]